MQAYAQIVVDPEAGSKFEQVFTSPTPMSGSTSANLSDLPVMSDHATARGSNRELTITTWNSQCHHIPTAFGIRTVVGGQREVRRPERPPRVTILSDGALNQVVGKMQSLNAVQHSQLVHGQGRFVTTTGLHLRTKPVGHACRSSVFSDAQASIIAAAFDEGRTTDEPPLDMVGDSDTGEVRATTRGNPSCCSSSSQAPEYDVQGEPTPPAKHAIATVVPIRTVRSVAMQFAGYKQSVPPKSPAMVAMESYASNNDRASTQPYMAAARSALPRDVPSIQELISYAASYNVSHIDTIPILRGILYSYPRHQDLWKADSYDRRFVRRQDHSTRGNVLYRIHQAAQAERVQVRVAAVTLPAFACHLRNLDPGMADVGVNGVNLQGMDTDWTVVPIDSGMIGQPWLLEYLLMFTSTELWAGRLSVLSQARYSEGAAAHQQGYITGMPSAHLVHIPGPKKLLLVLTDENTFSQATNLNLPGLGDIEVYRGVRVAPNVGAFNGFWHDIQNHLYALWTDAGYEQSCQNMVKCLQMAESQLCRTMAFHFAVSLASEIASYLPESPRLHGDDTGNYNDAVGGLWSLGVHNFNQRRPRHTTSDLNAGEIAVVNTRICRLLHGFSFGTVSPLQTHALSYTTLAHEEVMQEGVYMGHATFWHASTPDHVVDQYQCNIANSVYRILNVMHLIVKDDYSFSFPTHGGLQNTVTQHAVLLSLSLGMMLIKSDVTRRAWSGLGVNEAPLSQTPIREMVKKTCHGLLIPLNIDTHMALHINGNFSINNEIDAYYGMDAGNEQWGVSICMPYVSFLQWAAKDNISLTHSIVASDGVITANLESPHLVVDHTNSHAVTWVAGTLDTFSYLPACFLDYQRAVPYMLHMSVEDWQSCTAHSNDLLPAPSGMMSNLMTLGLKHHYRHVTAPGQALVINKYAQRTSAEMWSVSTLVYPDPVELSFLRPGVKEEARKEKTNTKEQKILEPPRVEEAPAQPQIPGTGTQQ